MPQACAPRALARAAPRPASRRGFATAGRAKVHTSTVALVPPDGAFERVQGVRYAVHDRGLWRWPPHVVRRARARPRRAEKGATQRPFWALLTARPRPRPPPSATPKNLLYPFAPLGDMHVHINALAEAAASVEPFDVTLGAFGTFAHRHSATLWLEPACEPAGALGALQAALVGAAPLFDDQRSLHGGAFTPHMSIAHFPSSNAARRAQEELARDWEPVSWRCSEVHVMAREGAAGQFRRLYRIGLGGGAPSALPDDPPHSYQHMPTEPPEWCKSTTRRYGARGGRRRKAKGAGAALPPEAI